MTIDGTDFRILEPRPFSKSWFSHKFKGPGVRYEIGVSIATGWIVWVNRPYRCGAWPDEKIAQDGLHHILEDGERYIADGGYKSRLLWFLMMLQHNKSAITCRYVGQDTRQSTGGSRSSR